MDALPGSLRFCPFRAETRVRTIYPGRRFALPWATCRLPFQGVLNNLLSQQKTTWVVTHLYTQRVPILSPKAVCAARKRQNARRRSDFMGGYPLQFLGKVVNLEPLQGSATALSYWADFAFCKHSFSTDILHRFGQLSYTESTKNRAN